MIATLINVYTIKFFAFRVYTTGIYGFVSSPTAQANSWNADGAGTVGGGMS